MRKMTLLLVMVTLLATGTASAGDWPSELRYVFYIAGKPSGENVMKFTESGDRLLIDTTCNVDFIDYHLDFKSRTEVDKETLAPLYYSFEGTKGEQAWSGLVTIDGDSVSGHLELDGNTFPSARRIEGLKFWFENYVTAHQILFMRRAAATESKSLKFTAFMPSDFIPAPASIELQTELEFTRSKKPIYCESYFVSLKNSEPWAVYYSPDMGLPIYFNFIASRTEVFLASEFESPPKTIYKMTEEEQGATGNN